MCVRYVWYVAMWNLNCVEMCVCVCASMVQKAHSYNVFSSLGILYQNLWYRKSVKSRKYTHTHRFHECVCVEGESEHQSNYQKICERNQTIQMKFWVPFKSDHQKTTFNRFIYIFRWSGTQIVPTFFSWNTSSHHHHPSIVWSAYFQIIISWIFTQQRNCKWNEEKNFKRNVKCALPIPTRSRMKKKKKKPIKNHWLIR